ncbi:TPA: sugar phosphate isomerase/epimerase [bacterium]|nr:sugar phosphate isomerase/epimerase [bacterium]
MNNYRIGCNTLYPDINERNTKGWVFDAQKIMQALDTNKRYGYTDVEYSHIYHLTVDDAHKIGQHANKIGIDSWSCHTGGPGGFDVSDAELMIKTNKHCIDIASAIGSRVNVIHIWGHKHDDACYVLDAVCKYALNKSIEIALENDGKLETMDFLLGLIEAVDMPNLGINVDTGHANLGDLDAGRAIRMAGSKLFTTHLQDNFGKVDDHMPPGMGFIDWEDVFLAFKEIDYKRTYMLELTDAPSSRAYDQEKEIKAGIRNVKGYMHLVGLI